MQTEITRIIKENSGLVYKIINKYSSYFDIDDLYQVGCIGLITAYKNYSNDFNTKFSSYAYLYILGEVSKYIREFRNIKVSKSYYQLNKRINGAKMLLSQHLMHEPSTYEIALFLEIDETIIADVINSINYVDSLDRVISSNDKTLSLYDTLGDNNNSLENLILEEELNKLDYTEQQLLNNRYYLDKTQSETANIMGITQVQVSRYEQKILKKLKTNMQ